MSDKLGGAIIPLDPAPRETMQDHVYRKVRDLILSGEIAPGRSITIKSLAEAFAVSHMPVREALHRLTAERALTVVSGRSMGIPPLSVARLADLRRVRGEIEGMAAAWAAERIDEEGLATLSALNAKLDQAVADNDVKGYLHANRDFHFAVYTAAGSATLLSMIESLWLQISPYFNLLHASGNYVESNAHHRALTEALHRRDPEAARKALQGDIGAAASVLDGLLD